MMTAPANQAESCKAERSVSRASPEANTRRVSIRSATSSDLALLKTLIHEFAEYEGFQASITEELLLRDGFGPRPLFRVFIAEWMNQPAGYALFFDHYSSFQGPSLFLEDIYVRDQFRGKGIGKALFAQLAAVALQENCVSIMFNVLDWNTSAIHVYRGLGASFLDEWKTLCLEGDALRSLAKLSSLETQS